MTTVDQHATRERLLDAAATVFASRGFVAGTVREITTRAGINHAAINYHFGSKLGLYHATLDRALSSAFLPLAQVPHAAQSAHETVRAMVQDLVEGSLQQQIAPIHIRLLSAELHSPTGALRYLIRDALSTSAGGFARRLRRVLVRGADTENDLLLAHWLIGSCLIAVQLAPDDAHGTTDAALAHQRQLTTRLTRLLSEGLAGLSA